jgi:hypothetical protein
VREGPTLVGAFPEGPTVTGLERDASAKKNSLMRVPFLYLVGVLSWSNGVNSLLICPINVGVVGDVVVRLQGRKRVMVG